MSEQIAQEYIYKLATNGEVQFSAQSSGLYCFDGQQWRNALASLNVEPFVVTAVALSPDFATDRTVFAGTSGMILRSMDAGESWEAFALPAPPPIITALAIAPDYADSGTIYAATLEDGVFVSTDRGQNWDAWNFGLIGFGVNALLVEGGGTLYAGNELGVFQSQNTGRSWREIAVLDAPVMALARASGGFFAGTDGAGFWQIHDGTSEQIASVDAAGTVEAILSDGANLLILCDNDLLLSRDSGATWNNLAPERIVLAAAGSHGLAPGAELLIGCEDGDIQTLHLP